MFRWLHCLAGDWRPSYGLSLRRLFDSNGCRAAVPAFDFEDVPCIGQRRPTERYNSSSRFVTMIRIVTAGYPLDSGSPNI